MIKALLLIFLPGTLWALVPEYNTYLRAGVGSNVKGAYQECISNQGAWGNEFRLGNECGIYGEFMIGGHILKAEKASDPYWKLFSDFAFVYDNKKTWEESNPRNWVMTELFTEAGNVDGLNFSLWVGKRYFRWSDVHSMDFYPVNMSGPGAGLGNLSLGNGIFSVAILQNASSDEINGASGVVTDKGSAAKTSLHLRWEQVKSSWGEWSFWLVGAFTPEAQSNTGNTKYQSTQGAFLAAKNNSQIESFSHELGSAFGHGNMSNMGSHGELVLDCDVITSSACTVQKSSRFRAWDSLTYEGAKWSTQLALIFDEYDKGTSRDSRVRWASVGIRPIYWFSDHLSLAFQAGISNIEDQSDGYGARNLGRFTIAPQMSLGKGFYSRPVLRAYYSRSVWNENNRISAAGTSAAKDLETDSIGVQTEVWF